MHAWRRRSIAIASNSISLHSTPRATGLKLKRQRIETTAPTPAAFSSRLFSSSAGLQAVRPFLLADIGEGIREVQIIQWFVQPGARVEQFDKLCEVQSDKASVEITSRFDGVIKKLHYEADDMAIVGKPLLDIDIQSDISPADEALTQPPIDGKEAEESASSKKQYQSETASLTSANEPAAKDPAASNESLEAVVAETIFSQSSTQDSNASSQVQKDTKSKHGTLATPAVRHLTKKHNIDLALIDGSGKDGRVLKEDVHKYISASASLSSSSSPSSASASLSSSSSPSSASASTLTPTSAWTAAAPPDRTEALSAVQNSMYKTMSKSLSIPHFLYTDSIDVSSLSNLRRQLNSSKTSIQKLSLLPFLLKAISTAFTSYPILNARLHISSSPLSSSSSSFSSGSSSNISGGGGGGGGGGGEGGGKPTLQFRGAHNFGIAVDTPSGLLVPVIRNVQAQSIEQLAYEIVRLSSLGREGKLGSADLQGGSFTVSNIGSIGGGVVSPIIVEGQLAIVGVGRTKTVPVFDGDSDRLIKREMCTLSWSADHRVVDGATVARAAELVRQLCEEPGRLLTRLH